MIVQGAGRAESQGAAGSRLEAPWICDRHELGAGRSAHDNG
jgi:hypothetical protein